MLFSSAQILKAISALTLPDILISSCKTGVLEKRLPWGQSGNHTRVWTRKETGARNVVSWSHKTLSMWKKRGCNSEHWAALPLPLMTHVTFGQSFHFTSLIDWLRNYSPIPTSPCFHILSLSALSIRNLIWPCGLLLPTKRSWSYSLKGIHMLPLIFLAPYH